MKLLNNTRIPDALLEAVLLKAGRRARRRTKMEKRHLRSLTLTCEVCGATVVARWRDGEPAAEALYQTLRGTQWQREARPNVHVWYCCDAHAAWRKLDKGSDLR